MTTEESPLEKLSRACAETKVEIASVVTPVIKKLQVILNAMSIDECLAGLDPEEFKGRRHFYSGFGEKKEENPVYHFHIKSGLPGNSITVEIDYGYKWNDPRYGNDTKLTIKIGPPLSKVHRIVRSPEVKQFAEALIKKHYGA